MLSATTTLRAQRWTLAVVLFASAATIVPGIVEPFMLVKATAVVVGAVVLAAIAGARVAATGRLSLPTGPVVAVVGVVVGALVVATVTSSAPVTSLIGVPSRYSGLLPYLAYVTVFLATLAVLDAATIRLLARTAVVALGLTVLYGLLQWRGIEPAGVSDIGLGRTFSFFGNTNFAGAWAGAASGLALMVAASRDEHRAWRIGAAVLLPLSLLYVLITRTSQGPLVFVVAVGWCAAVLALAPGGRLRQAAAARPGVLVGGLAAVVLAVLVPAVLFRGPLRAELDQALVERPDFWNAALSIFADHPWVGTGLDTYAHFFLAYRPPSHPLLVGYGSADAPHSVPLAMLSNGGLLLGLAHVAFVVTVGYLLLRGTWRATGATRLALAGFGGAWWGYQAQSLVSFDVPPLALLHWLSAGVVVALTAPPRWRAVDLPGRPRPSRPAKRVSAALPPPQWALPVQAGVALLAVTATWFALYPLRADVVASRESEITSAEAAERALANFERAAALNPADPGYPYLAAQTYSNSELHQQAFDAAREAARRDPGNVEYAFFVAREAQLLGDRDGAAEWIREAARRDPSHAATLVQAGGYLSSIGQTQEGRALLERALELEPDNVQAQELLVGVQG